MKGYIYKIENNINGKIYIGQTRQKLEERYKQHIRDSKKDKFPFHCAIQKYGKENFTLSIVKEIEEDNIQKLIDSLNILEKEYIKQFNTRCPNGYNVEPGGNSHYYKKLTSSNIITNQIVYLPEDHQMLPQECLIYLIIQLYTNKGCSEVSLNSLSKLSKKSIPTLRTIIKNIEAKDYIIVDRESKCTKYYLHIDKEGQPFSKEFLEKGDISFTTKSYLVASQQYMYQDVEGFGKISFPNTELSKKINMPESTIRKCNQELQRKNYLTIIENESRDLETGCKTNTKLFNLNELGQAIIWVLKNHEDRITQNTKDIEHLMIEIEKLKESNKQKDILLSKLVKNEEPTKFILD